MGRWCNRPGRHKSCPGSQLVRKSERTYIRNQVWNFPYVICIYMCIQKYSHDHESINNNTILLLNFILFCILAQATQRLYYTL